MPSAYEMVRQAGGFGTTERIAELEAEVERLWEKDDRAWAIVGWLLRECDKHRARTRDVAEDVWELTGECNLRQQRIEAALILLPEQPAAAMNALRGEGVSDGSG